MANWSKLQEDLVGLPVAKRAKHGIHFQKGANEFVANFSGKPCHYEDGGIWKPIDTKLVLLPDGFYGCPHSKVKVHPDGRVAVAGTDYAQRVELPSAKTGLTDGDKLIREFSFGKQEMRITENGYRSEITLNRVPTLREARKLIASESGTLSKEYLKSLTTATDANGDVHTVTTLSAFRTWLAAAKFPVVIDPDFTGDTADGWITSYSNGTWSQSRTNAKSINTTGTLLVIRERYVTNPLYGKYRSYLLFDTSSIGSGSTVTQVNLKVYVTRAATDKSVYIIKQDWSSQNPLSTANMDTVFQNTLTSDKDSASFTMGSGTQTSGNLSTAWVSKTGTTYYSLIIDDDYDDISNMDNIYIEIASQNHTTESYRPVLTVTYTAAGGFHSINMNGQMQNLSGGMRG